jgi:hypothetical protein
MTYHIIPKPTSPYADLNFPAGIPVLHPIPIGMSCGDLVWDLDFDRLTPDLLIAIADAVARFQCTDAAVVLEYITRRGEFSIQHEYVFMLVGDDTTTDELEAFGRSYRAKILLEQSAVGITVCMQLLDAIAIYSELGQAVWIIGSNDPESETAELVGNWLDTVPPAIAPHAPELAQVLINKREEDCDKMVGLLESIDRELEIKLSIAPYTAYLAIASLQLMSRNPNSKILDNIRHYIRTLSAGILQIAPEVEWLIERGWHSEFDGGGN